MSIYNHKKNHFNWLMLISIDYNVSSTYYVSSMHEKISFIDTYLDITFENKKF